LFPAARRPRLFRSLQSASARRSLGQSARRNALMWRAVLYIGTKTKLGKFANIAGTILNLSYSSNDNVI
jgi:hypothetical protein